MNELAGAKASNGGSVPIVAPWLGVAAECVTDRGIITLRDAASGAEVQLTPHAFAEREGRVLRFRIPVAHVIDFAGIRWNGCYEFACHDEATAAMLGTCFEQMLGDHFTRTFGLRRA